MSKLGEYIPVDRCVGQVRVYGPGRAHLRGAHLEAAVVLGDRVGKVHALPLAQELTQLRPLLQPQVVADEVPIDAVPSPLLLVQQDVGRCGDTGWGQR